MMMMMIIIGQNDLSSSCRCRVWKDSSCLSATCAFAGNVVVVAGAAARDVGFSVGLQWAMTATAAAAATANVNVVRREKPRLFVVLVDEARPGSLVLSCLPQFKNKLVVAAVVVVVVFVLNNLIYRYVA